MKNKAEIFLTFLDPNSSIVIPWAYPYLTFHPTKAGEHKSHLYGKA